jgi:hypothetical protein
MGNVATFTQTSEDITPDIRAQQWEIYVQDDWRVRPNFTLNLGVRYSNFRQPIDAKHELTNFDPAVYNRANAPAFTSAGNLATGTPYPYLNGIIANNQNSPFGSAVSSQSNSNIAPRVGFAWDPTKTGKTAIRGGYGIFYDATLYGIYEQNIFANPPFVNSVSISNVTLDNPAAGTASIASPKVLHATPVKFQTPYTQQWSLTVERQLTTTSQLSVAYVGNKGTHLLGEVDLNSVYPGLAWSSGFVSPSTVFTSSGSETVLNPLRPYPGYNAINTIEPWFNSNYNSLQVYGQKRFGGDSLAAVSYTWSKNLTDNQTDRSTAAQNLYNFNEGEYGRAQYDRTHVFNANFVYMLPFFRAQQGFVGHVLGGWELSGIISYYTGLPMTVTTSNVDPAGLGILGSSAAGPRPDLVAGCNPNNYPHTRFAWINPACFAQVPAGVHRPGDAGRGIIQGPGYEGWNLSASKNLTFHERFRFQLRGEASNAFNHANPSGFGSLNTTNSLFNQITAYRDPRIIQLGAKFYF